MGFRTNRGRSVGVCLALAGVALAGPAGGEEWTFVGARYQGMGGAGVAVVDDATAAHWNPGALAFGETREASFPLSFSTTIEGDTLAQADAITDFLDATAFGGILAKMEGGQPLTLSELRDALELVGGLAPGLDDEGEGGLALPDAGLQMRMGRLSVSVRGFGSLGIDPLLDAAALAFSSDLDVPTQIANVVGLGSDRSGQFANPASQSLADSIAAATAWSQDQAEELVFQSEQAGLDTSAPGIQGLVTEIATQTGALGTQDLAQNASGAELRSLVTQEIGLGYAQPLFGGRVGIGGNLRYVRGVTSFQHIDLDALASGTDVLDELTDFENTEVSQRVAVDAGILLRPGPRLRLGLVARNLNGPEFDLAGPGDFGLDPQVRVGIAYRLLPNWLVATDVDVTENETDALDGYGSRLLSVGTEFRIPLREADLALRAGAFTNVASGAERAVTVTAGLGLRLGSLAFDLALGASPDFQEIRDGGTRIPRRIHVSGVLRWLMEP